MKYTIVVDSMASLPESILRNRPIKVLPIHVVVDGESMLDTSDAEELVALYSSDIISIDSNAESISPSKDEIQEFMLNEVVLNCDVAVCQTVSKSLSPIFDNFNEVSMLIAKDARQLRDERGISTQFRMSISNSGTTIAGQGLIALYADMALAKGMNIAECNEQIGKFSKATRCYAVVKDLVYARSRAEKRGVKTFGLPFAVFGKAIGLSPVVEITRDTVVAIALKPSFKNGVNTVLKYAVEAIVEGLYFPIISINYAGDLDDIRSYKMYQRLEKAAEKHKVMLVEGVMSLTATINYAPGTFAIGIAPKVQDSKPS